MFCICCSLSPSPTLPYSPSPPSNHKSLLYVRVCFISHKSICVWFLPQFSSVAQSCPTLCHPMNCSTPGLPIHHQFPESTQTHVRRVSDFFLVCGESVVISHWNHCFFGAFMCTLFFFFLIRFSNILTLSLPFFFFQMISILSENLSEGKWKLLRLADKLKKKIFFNVCLFGCSRSQLWHMGPSSSTRDWSWAPCIGSVSLSHWITREVQKQKF